MGMGQGVSRHARWLLPALAVISGVLVVSLLGQATGSAASVPLDLDPGQPLRQWRGPDGPPAGRQPSELRVRLRGGVRLQRRQHERGRCRRDRLVARDRGAGSAQRGLLARGSTASRATRRTPAPALTMAGYRQAVQQYVTDLNNAGLYVILDLHWTAPGRACGRRPAVDARRPFRGVLELGRLDVRLQPGGRVRRVQRAVLAGRGQRPEPPGELGLLEVRGLPRPAGQRQRCERRR